MDDFLGPFCQEIHLSIDNLNDPKPIKNGVLKTGVLFELYSHYKTVAKVIHIVHILEPSLATSSVDSLSTKFKRLLETKKKLVSKKKVKGVSYWDCLLQQTFQVQSRKLNVTPCKTSQVDNLHSETIQVLSRNGQGTEIQTLRSEIHAIKPPTKQNYPDAATNVSSNSSECRIDLQLHVSKSQQKDLNLFEYEISKKRKTLDKLLKEIKVTEEVLSSLNNKVGHYLVRNVNKRDEKARATRQALRDSEARVRSLTKSAETNQKLQQQNKNLLVENEKLNDRINILNDKVTNVENVERKKINAQKSAHYYKTKAGVLREKLNYQAVTDNVELKERVRVSEEENQSLRSELELLGEKLSCSCTTTNKDGSYTDGVRLCVIELAALEVATEKVPLVIQTVSKHLFSNELEKGDLPNKTSVQSMIDEGQYLARTFIGTQIKAAKSWGLNRDGTTRQKKKILDTSVTLDSGDVMSLGFTRVAHETAKTIHHVTVRHLEQLSDLQSDIRDSITVPKCPSVITIPTETPKNPSLSDIRDSITAQKCPSVITIPTETPKNLSLSVIRDSITAQKCPSVTPVPTETPNNDEFILDSLKKLSYTMCDRASNEKLADKMLDQWRDGVLQKCCEKEKEKVHHVHCMAHVLLGLHKYASSDLKIMEKEIIEENGPLGRDALSYFKFWAKRGTCVERVARTVSDIFGPAGDHYGLRDKWEAYCAHNGIKTIIGNYRDNRFNALFQTSAEILLHSKDMLTVISTIQHPNQKITSVRADLQSDPLMTILQCFGLFYLKITGPYWNLVTEGKVPYLLLYTYIQSLASFLIRCSERPQMLLENPDANWSEDSSETSLSDVPHRKRLASVLFTVDKKQKELLFKTTKVIATAMLKCVEKQLVDFLPNGKYSKAPSSIDLKRTQYSHSTNLGCEHHFGDLDSSQKRRPNASMHHHTSVQVLKCNRKKLMNWLLGMPKENREDLMKKARKGGRELRAANMSVEKAVLKEINDEMINEKSNPKKRRKLKLPNEIPDEEDEEDYASNYVLNKLPAIDMFVENEYLAVAYQDQWYPGIVISTKDNAAVVKFMSPSRKPGYFTWPSREDTQVVDKEFVLKRGFIPQCVNSGRQWLFEEYEEIDTLFATYKLKYFEK